MVVFLAMRSFVPMLTSPTSTDRKILAKNKQTPTPRIHRQPTQPCDRQALLGLAMMVSTGRSPMTSPLLVLLLLLVQLLSFDTLLSAEAFVVVGRSTASNVSGRSSAFVSTRTPTASAPRSSAVGPHRMIPMDLLPTEILGGAISTGGLTLNINQDQAEALAGPFFGLSLFPYLAFLYFLNVKENDCPKGVTVGFATCLLFVFLTIPAAIVAKLQYGVSLADSDWLHGSAESLLTITNLVTVVAFRQALEAKEASVNTPMPQTALSYRPMVLLVAFLTVLAGATALVPAAIGAEVHTPYLGGFMDLPFALTSVGANAEPENALTVACWIIHISSLVEFLVAMGFAWRWADVVDNPKWKGLTWGLLPLHSSGITACTYHLFYNRIPILVPLQAFLTCVGNTTAAYAALRIALSNGWIPPQEQLRSLVGMDEDGNNLSIAGASSSPFGQNEPKQQESASLVGFEDLGDALAGDNDYSFLLKLFGGCAVASYAIKYGETFFDFPYDADVALGLAVVFIPSFLNAFKWWKRSQDPTFEGWF